MAKSETSDLMVALLIHLLLPILGLLGFVFLARRLVSAGASRVFLGQVFFLFVCYGGLLLMTLTVALWHWSAMASFGLFFLIFIAPVLLLFVLFDLRHHQPGSVIHRNLSRACLAYYFVLPALLIFGYYAT